MDGAPTLPTLYWTRVSEWSWAEGRRQMARGTRPLSLAEPGRHPSSLPACGLSWVAVFPEGAQPGMPSGGVTGGFPPVLLASVLWLNGAAGP